MFGPLAGLLLFSRPGTLREWLWLLLAVAWSAIWLDQVGGLGAQVARAAAALLCGSFLALTLWRPSNQVGRAVAATAGAALALVAWMRGLGIGWARLMAGIDQDLGSYRTALRAQWQSAGIPADLIDQMVSLMHSAGQLYPALLAIAGIAGLRLAWAWYHRVAARPLGPPPAPFREFGFNDQLVWGFVVSLSLALLPVPEPWRIAGSNLLLVFGALYAARGLAVVLAQAGRVPPPVWMVLVFLATFLLPFVVGGLTLLGLADTWLDFRRRHSAPATGGFDR